MNTSCLIVLTVLVSATLIQLVYWAFIMFRTRKRARNLAVDLPPVSVIICARNEAENLARLIPQLIAQKYAAEKQIVVVDDGSTDDTPMTLARMRVIYPELYTTSIPIDNKFSHGKKLAITVGIKAAKYEHLIFTDADCQPATENWLTAMAEQYANEKKEIVLGYGRYARRPGLLNLLIRYETFWNAVQYMGMAVAIRPFMGVGRNLSYTKSLFGRSSQFRTTMNILSGDDDLFVCEMGRRSNTAIAFEPAAQTISEPKHTWMEYVAQKSRHLTTAPLYPALVKFILGLEQTSRLVYWLSLVGAGVLAYLTQDTILVYAALGALTLRTIIIYTALGIAARGMGESKMWLVALPMDIAVPTMQALAWITGVATQSRNTWK